MLHDNLTGWWRNELYCGTRLERPSCDGMSARRKYGATLLRRHLLLLSQLAEEMRDTIASAFLVNANASYRCWIAAHDVSSPRSGWLLWCQHEGFPGSIPSVGDGSSGRRQG